MQRQSLAARLTLWYSATAFLLVVFAAFLQYRALLGSLEQEDDQLLLERFASTPVVSASAPSDPGSSPRAATELTGLVADVIVRELTTECLPVGDTGPPILPVPSCQSSAKSPQFSSWKSPRGENWRILTGRIAETASSGAAQPWREVYLNRTNDESVLRAYRSRIAIVLVTTLLAAAGLGHALARRGLAPLSLLAKRVAAVDASSLGQRLITADAPAEVAELAGSFDSMLERLESAFQSLSHFSTHLAHEFRTPMHVLRQQAEVVLRRPRTPEEYRDVLASSLEEFDRLQRMVDDILLLARTEDPRAALHKETFSVQKELTDVAEYFDAAAAEASVTLETGGATFDIFADRMLVRRALVNLVSNSLRHTPAGGRIRLSAHIEGRMAVIEVTDTGEGVPPANAGHVFERHYRVGGQASVSEGSGLGLPIVRGIMLAHGGSATMASVPGSGTSVRLAFARLAPDDG